MNVRGGDPGVVVRSNDCHAEACGLVLRSGNVSFPPFMKSQYCEESLYLA